MAMADETNVIGTPCLNTTADALVQRLKELAGTGRTWAIDFTNVHIVTMRHEDAGFARALQRFDFFVADSQVLFFAIRLLGGDMPARIYGPAFLPFATRRLPRPFTHYFLGGSEACSRLLLEALRRDCPDLDVVGAHHGYFAEHENEQVIDDIKRCDPDFIWVGLGTPKQQHWIASNRDRLPRGVLLAVGFAFDVNAGTKRDAPAVVQRLGLTWAFRLVKEPRRLWKRYAKYNPLFVARTALQLVGLRDYRDRF